MKKPSITIRTADLALIFPRLPVKKASEYAPLLSAAMTEFEITTTKRAAAFLSQLAHESMELTRWEENLNYSAKRLTQVWPRRFPTLAAAAPYAKRPEALANKTYGGRMGNTRPGDGYKFRGRCPIQATGRGMYAWLELVLDLPLTTNPDLLLQPEHGLRAAAAIFAVEKKLNPVADRLTLTSEKKDSKVIEEITRAINGGLNGLAERREYFTKALRALSTSRPAPQSQAMPSPNTDERPTQTETMNAPVQSPATASPIESAEIAPTAPPAAPVADEISLKKLAEQMDAKTAKMLGRNLKKRLGAKIGTVFSAYMGALAAGNIALWVLNFIIIAGLIWIVWTHRYDFMRLLRWALGKAKDFGGDE